MNKMIMVSCGLLLVVVAAFGQEEKEKLAELMRHYEAREHSTLPKDGIDEIRVLNAEGARAYIEELNGLYSWRLLREYWHDYDIDTTGATTGLYLDYDPNSDLARLFPAVFALWHSKPYATLADYVAVFILASKINAGTTYLELSNKPDTLYAGIPGWDYSYTYRSGLISYAVKSHMLLLNGVAFNVFFLTTKTDFDDSISRLWYSLVMSGVQFNGATIVSEHETFERVRSFLLLPNYPNPFNAGTTIPYRVAQAGQVKIEILDATGRMVQRLLNGFHEPGEYHIHWAGKTSGVYFYKMTSAGGNEIRRMVLVK